MKPDRIAYYSYAHIPWIKPGQRKFTEKDLPVDKEKRELYEIGKEAFAKNGYVEIGMDHFALQTDSLYKATLNQTLHRNFMGYTNSYTKLMIGLGVSSISDTWNAFGQNVKTVEHYYELINENKFPIFKSHHLSPEDLILRQHILNIMCKFETNWSSPEQQCLQTERASLLLDEMQKDDLITIDKNNLTIHESARAYIRNVCMAFDAYLYAKQPDSQIFSTTA